MTRIEIKNIKMSFKRIPVKCLARFNASTIPLFSSIYHQYLSTNLQTSVMLLTTSLEIEKNEVNPSKRKLFCFRCYFFLFYYQTP